jgi:hypothetical protein
VHEHVLQIYAQKSSVAMALVVTTAAASASTNVRQQTHRLMTSPVLRSVVVMVCHTAVSVLCRELHAHAELTSPCYMLVFARTSLKKAPVQEVKSPLAGSLSTRLAGRMSLAGMNFKPRPHLNDKSHNSAL